jgi:C4-dicarboxylate-specific signal transduction histidine kinase
MRYERERRARREAEDILHDKAREIYLINQTLAARAQELSESMEVLKSAQDALVRQGKLAALGGLVAGVAHEINTPLGVGLTAVSITSEHINAFTAMFESGRISRSGALQLLSEMRESITLAESNMRRAAVLVRSFKKVAVDRSNEALCTGMLKGLLADVIQSLSPMVRASGVSTRLLVDNDGLLTIDAGAVGQVLTNLIQNACLHAFSESSDSPLITVRGTVLSDRIELVVADNGCGMSAEVSERIWEPFFTTRRGEGGSGLGMHITHTIIVDHFGGTITIATQSGHGSCYKIGLPSNTNALTSATPA